MTDRGRAEGRCDSRTASTGDEWLLIVTEARGVDSERSVCCAPIIWQTTWATGVADWLGATCGMRNDARRPRRQQTSLARRNDEAPQPQPDTTHVLDFIQLIRRPHLMVRGPADQLQAYSPAGEAAAEGSGAAGVSACGATVEDFLETAGDVGRSAPARRAARPVRCRRK